MKAYEDCKEYDHLEHLALYQRHEQWHDSYDTYAHVHAEGNDIEDTYSHVQRGQYFQTDLSIHVHNSRGDATYEQTRIVGCGESDTYDHFRTPVIEVQEQISNYEYAHAQNSAVTEGDYDNAVVVDRHDKDIYQ